MVAGGAFEFQINFRKPAMNLKFEKNEIRIRLSSSEWLLLQRENILKEDFSLGGGQALSFELFLAESSVLEYDNLRMSLRMDRNAIKMPVRKKDPYWVWTTPSGLRLSLDVDIFPEKTEASK